MRILYVSQAILPSQITNSLSIMNMCQAFEDCGYHVDLMGYRPRRKTEEVMHYYGLRGGFNVQTFYFPKIISWLRMREYLYSFMVRRKVVELRPDLIYSRLSLSALGKIPSDTPVIFEMHSPEVVAKSGYRKNRFVRLSQKKNFKRIIVTTRALSEYLADKLPHLDIVIARLSAEKPMPMADDDITDFKKMNINGDAEFKVGYTGFLDNSGLRGMDVICRTAEKLPHVDFHVVGGTKEMVRFWSRRAPSGNLYFYGHKKPSLIPWYLKSFDVVLAPLQRRTSLSKPLGKGMSPLKIPQYLAYGCVIAASDVPAHMEILKHGENAMICEAANIDHWASTLDELRMNEDLRHVLSGNAYRTYLNEFTPEIRVQKIFSGLRV